MKKKLLLSIFAVLLLSCSNNVNAVSFNFGSPSKSTYFVGIAGGALAYAGFNIFKKTAHIIATSVTKTAEWAKENAMEIACVSAGVVLAVVFKDELFSEMKEISSSGSVEEDGADSV